MVAQWNIIKNEKRGTHNSDQCTLQHLMYQWLNLMPRSLVTQEYYLSSNIGVSSFSGFAKHMLLIMS